MEAEQLAAVVHTNHNKSQKKSKKKSKYVYKPMKIKTQKPKTYRTL